MGLWSFSKLSLNMCHCRILFTEIFLPMQSNRAIGQSCSQNSSFLFQKTLSMQHSLPSTFVMLNYYLRFVVFRCWIKGVHSIFYWNGYRILLVKATFRYYAQEKPREIQQQNKWTGLSSNLLKIILVLN